MHFLQIFRREKGVLFFYYYIISLFDLAYLCFWFLLRGYLLLKIFILGVIWNCYVVQKKGQWCNANDTKILVSDYCVSASYALVNQSESSWASMPLRENFMWFLSLGECGSSIHICNKHYIELAIVIYIHVLGVVLCSAWYFWNSRIYRELSRNTSFAVLSISFLLYCVFFKSFEVASWCIMTVLYYSSIIVEDSQFC